MLNDRLYGMFFNRGLIAKAFVDKTPLNVLPILLTIITIEIEVYESNRF